MAENQTTAEKVRYKPPVWLTILSVTAIIIGVLAAFIGLVVAPAVDAWTWLLLGFLYFGGLAQGILVWSAIFRVAQTRWTSAVNRLGHSSVGFLFVSFLVLIILMGGARYYIPWIADPVPDKQAWLNLPFMAARDVIGMGLLVLLSFLLVRWSLAADAKVQRGEAIIAQDQARLTAVGTAVLICYTLAFSLIAWDLIMSLWPSWYSTMFAPYYFMTNLYASMAFLILLAAILRKPLRIERYLGIDQFHDMGNLMLGFGLFSMGLFFAQYLTIWYANIPHETEFIVNRYLYGVWPIPGWLAFIIGYAIPFIALIPKRLKLHPGWLGAMAVLALSGVALERYVLVVPSVAFSRMLISPFYGLVLLAFAGAFILCFVFFIQRYAAVSSAEAALPPVESLEVLA